MWEMFVTDMFVNCRNLSRPLLYIAGALFLLLPPQSAGAQDVDLCNHPLADPVRAISACTRLLNGDSQGPQSAGWFNNRGVGKLKKGDVKHAIEDFTEALNRNPDYFDALMNRGIAYHMGEDYDSAIGDFNRALLIDSTSKRAAPIYNMRGSSLSRKGEYPRAIEDFGNAIKLNDQYVQAYVNRGDAYSATRQFVPAIADFNTAIKLTRTNPLVYIHRGDAREQRADFAGAISDYSAAIGLDPNSWEAFSHRGEAWRLQRDLAKSIADHNKSIQLNPTAKEAYLNRAFAWGDQGEFDKAIADCTEALVHDPNYALAYADRGRFKRLNNLKKDLKGSLNDLNKAVKLDPSSPVALTFRGDTLREWDDNAGAMKDFNEAIDILPDFVAAYTGRGLTYEKKGDAEKAKADYQKALGLSAELDAGLARPAQDLARARLDALDEQERTATLPKTEPAKSIPVDIQQALYHRGHALLIGVSDYKTGWPQLPNVKNDLQELKAGLDPYFETVEIVQNPTVSELRGRMSEFVLDQWNNPNERLFIYYAGHGFTAFNQASTDNDGYITGSDTPGKSVAKAVSFFEVDSWSRNTSARHVLMVFDSCFSGSLFQTMGPEQEPSPNDLDNVRTLLRKPMRYYITAGRQNEEVAADSTFAKLLLRGLRGGADKYHEGIISAEELGNYLYHEVPKDSPRPQTPQYKSIGNAALSEGQFFFLSGPAAGDVTSTVSPSRAPPGTKANGPGTLSNKSGIK